MTSDRGSPWSNTFHVQQNGRRDEDDGGFLTSGGSQRGSFAAKRDSLASRDQITGSQSNRDLTATPSSMVTVNSLPRSTIGHSGSGIEAGTYTPRSYTPRAEPITSLPRNHTNHVNTNSSLSRTHSAKLEGALPRSHSSMDTLGRGKAMHSGTDMQSSASLPRTNAIIMNGGGNSAPVTTNGRFVLWRTCCL